MINRILGLVSISMLLNSCAALRKQDEYKASPFRGPVNVEVERKNPEAEPALADPGCTAENALNDMGSKVSVWVYGSDKPVTYDFSGVSGRGLVSKWTTGTVLGYHNVDFYEECTSTGSKTKYNELYTCMKYQQQRVSDGFMMNFCKAGGYPKDSAENAALAVLAGILVSARFFDQVPPHVTKYPVEVLMFPKVETRVRRADQQIVSGVKTDNAYWTSATRNQSRDYCSLNFLLHSTEERAFFKEQRLFLQPPISAHEWGHNAFWGMTENLHNVSRSRGAIDETVSEPKAYAQATREVTGRTVIDAINEGYADLNAYYGHDSGLMKASQITFGHRVRSRDPGDEKNEDARDKALTASVLKHFFNTVKTDPDDKVRTPDHQDVHTIGAIIASAFNRLFAERVGATAGDPRTLQKAIVLTEWLITINEKFPEWRDLEPRALLERIVWTAIEYGMLKPGQLTEEQCKTITEKFPVYLDDWKGRYTCA